jgi:SnoaL-like domain
MASQASPAPKASNPAMTDATPAPRRPRAKLARQTTKASTTAATTTSPSAHRILHRFVRLPTIARDVPRCRRAPRRDGELCGPPHRPGRRGVSPQTNCRRTTSGSHRRAHQGGREPGRGLRGAAPIRLMSTLQVADRAALSDLVHRYAANVDDRQFDTVTDLFMPIAELAVRRPPPTSGTIMTQKLTGGPTQFAGRSQRAQPRPAWRPCDR